MSVPQDAMQEIINRPSLLQRLRPVDRGLRAPDAFEGSPASQTSCHCESR